MPPFVTSRAVPPPNYPHWKQTACSLRRKGCCKVSVGNGKTLHFTKPCNVCEAAGLPRSSTTSREVEAVRQGARIGFWLHTSMRDGDTGQQCQSNQKQRK